MKFSLAVILSVCLIGCNRHKGPDMCGAYLLQGKGIDSQVTRFVTVRIEDAITATISGQVLSKLYDGQLDTLPATYLTFSNNEKDIEVVSDLSGKYSVNLKEGVYSIKVMYIGHNTLEIENISIKNGEVKVLDLLLSEGFGTTRYTLTEANEFKKVK